MAISGSITKVSSTQTSITVSWNITTTASNPNAFTELQVYGPGVTFVDINPGSKPVTGSATVSGLSPGTSYTFGYGGIDKLNATGGNSYSFSTDPAPVYTVYWSPNGGSVAPTSNSGTSGTYTTAPIPTRTGFSFNGWYSASSGGSLVVAGGSAYQITSDVVLYAQWTALTPKVWNGSEWVRSNLKVWNGSAWVSGTMKIWNGSEWTNPL